MRSVRRAFLLAGGVTALAVAPAATASQLLDRNAQGVKLFVNGKGEALVTYTANGSRKRVLAWGAVNAKPPVRGTKQVEFRLDRAGGYGRYRKNYWKTFGTACGAYDGPPLAWRVTACKAPDGSYWALQAWQRGLPNYGVPASGRSSAWELHLSHWTGDLAVLTLGIQRSKHDRLFGSYVLGDTGIYGFGSTRVGNPTDSFGRNVYVDTFNSAYGAGWKRENSFLTHRSGGTFCYLVGPNSRGIGTGKKYRATVIGPGVMPDLMWTGTPPTRVGAADKAAAIEALRALNDPDCKP